MIRTAANTKVYYLWFLASIFYLYQYIIRTLPSVTVKNMSLEYNFNVNEISAYNICFPYAYSLMQVPVGIITDKIGVRKVIIGSAICCVLGSLLASFCDTFALLMLSRVIVGIGGASSLVVAFKVSSDHFTSGMRGLFMGITMAIGLSGAMFCNSVWFISWVNIYGLTLCNLVIAIVGLILIILLIFDISKDNNIGSSDLGFLVLKRSCTQIIQNKPLLKYIVLVSTAYLPMSVLFDVWNVTFLNVTYNFDNNISAQINRVGYIGSIVGCVFLPIILAKYHKNISGLAICTFCICICWFILLFYSFDNMQIHKGYYFIFGVVSGAEIVAFSCAASYISSENSGALISIINTINNLISAMLINLVGIIANFVENSTSGFSDTQMYYGLMPHLIFIFIALLVSMNLIFTETSK